MELQKRFFNDNKTPALVSHNKLLPFLVTFKAKRELEEEALGSCVRRA